MTALLMKALQKAEENEYKMIADLSQMILNVRYKGDKNGFLDEAGTDPKYIFGNMKLRS